MYRLFLALLWLSLPAWGQSITARQFIQQHRADLDRQFGRQMSESELVWLLGYVIDQQHTEVLPSQYVKAEPAPLASLLAQRRGQGDPARLADLVVFPLLRYVLPRLAPSVPLRPGAPAGEQMAALAHRYLGVRYGSPTYDPRTSQGTLDCSGLVNRVLADARLLYRRGTGTGATEGLVNSSSFQIVTDTPQPGDLLARQHGGRWRHVGLYVGNGYLIEAPYQGTVVRRVAYRPAKWERVLRYRHSDSQ